MTAAPSHATDATATSRTAAAGPTQPRSRAKAFPPGECDALLRTIDAAVATGAIAAARATTSVDDLLVLTHRLERTATAFEVLRNRMTSPVLAAEANELMMTSAYVTHEVAELAGLKHLGERDLSAFERSIDMGTRQRALAFRSARARCEEEGSRAQSAAFSAALAATFSSLHDRLGECYRAERALGTGARVGRMTLRLHVGGSGRVELVGPTDLWDSAYSSNLAACIVEIVEKATFPRPEGTAIIDVPFEVSETPTDGADAVTKLDPGSSVRPSK